MIRDTSLASRMDKYFLQPHKPQSYFLGIFCSPRHDALLTWSPRHSLGLSRPVGVIGWVLAPLQLVPGEEHKALTYFSETIKCL